MYLLLWSGDKRDINVYLKQYVLIRSAVLETSCDGMYGERGNEVLPD